MSQRRFSYGDVLRLCPSICILKHTHTLIVVHLPVPKGRTLHVNIAGTSTGQRLQLPTIYIS